MSFVSVSPGDCILSFCLYFLRVTKEIRETQDLLDLPVFLGQEVGDQCR